MSIFENIKMAMSSLLAHKMRSILTMLGIIIGVGSVIAVVAIGQGGEAVLKEQFTGEANAIELFYNPSEEEIEQNPDIFLMPAFTQADVDLLRGIEEIDEIVTTSNVQAEVHYKEEVATGNVNGVTQTYLTNTDLTIKEGRSLHAADFMSGARVALVSESYEEALFEEEDKEALGKIIYLASQPVEIVGIVKAADSLFDVTSGEVYLPNKTWQTVFNETAITQMTLKVADADDLKVAGEKAVEILNREHETEGYEVFNLEEIAKGISKITGIMTLIISSIAGVSLLVGGIGVMNIMLVSVTERTREIGVRMSLGATRGQILFQFLIESMTLTVIGGVIGMFFGTGVAFLVSYFAGWPPLVSWYVILGGVLFSMTIGIVFGILPANKASKLDPIEALRYE